MQRYALFLQGHDHDIEYKSLKSHANCDVLSRLPYPHSEELSDSDSVEITLDGWTYKPQDERLKLFYMRRNELSVQNGCHMWGIRVIIPIKLRNKVLDELHVGHIGIVKMKELSRSFVW